MNRKKSIYRGAARFFDAFDDNVVKHLPGKSLENGGRSQTPRGTISRRLLFLDDFLPPEEGLRFENLLLIEFRLAAGTSNAMECAVFKGF